MKVTETLIPGVLILEPRVFADDRGYFFESYNKQTLKSVGIDVDFVQDNQSMSKKGTLRGLHAQAEPFGQGKLVSVVRGSVMDVAVDARKGSPTYGRHVSVELSAQNKLQLWIPVGCLHGFVTLEDDTIFTYKVTNGYDKQSETGIIWNDPTLAIGWGIDERDALLSEKDQQLPEFATYDSPFTY
jgi:dTDP-4-dehydrorhamnose 3,5-epimerase